MNRRCSRLNFPLCAALLLAGAWTAGAQESIIFSKPTDNNLTERANSFMEQVPHKLTDSYSAPAPLFGRKPKADFDVLPGMPKPVPLSPEQIKQMQKNLDQQRNWTLMTPAEILNVPTVEKILGVPDGNENLTVLELYHKRQDRQRSAASSNALLRAETYWNAEGNPFGGSRADQKKNAAGLNPQNQFGQPLNRAGNTALETEQQLRREESPWGASAFDMPPPAPKPDKEQLAAMERFRAMMLPPQLEKPVVAAAGFTPTPKSKADPNMQAMPAFNPAGNSFQPIHDNASRPIGIAPLPTVTGFRPQMGKVPKPKPLVEPPPWVKDENKPAKPSAAPETFLQRKF